MNRIQAQPEGIPFVGSDPALSLMAALEMIPEHCEGGGADVKVHRRSIAEARRNYGDAGQPIVIICHRCADKLKDELEGTLTKSVRRFGSDHSVNFADGAIDAAVRRLGSWQHCCNQRREQFDLWFRKAFITTFITILKEGASEGERRYLVGEFESQHAA